MKWLNTGAEKMGGQLIYMPNKNGKGPDGKGPKKEEQGVPKRDSRAKGRENKDRKKREYFRKYLENDDE